MPSASLAVSACVGLYTVTLDDDATLLRAGAEQLDGLVVAGFGVGHVPEPLVPVLADLATRVPVILASRTAAGPVLTTTYGFPGSERDLIAHGLIPAGWLNPYKARVLLRTLLTSGVTRPTIAAAIAAAGGLNAPTAWPWPAPAVPAPRS